MGFHTITTWDVMRTSRITQDLEKVSDWPERAREAGYCSYRLANLLDVQERTLRRYIQKQFGHSTYRHLELLRQEKIEDLAKAGVPEKAIAVQVHFKHAAHLSRRFKEIHGVTLRLWLKSESAPPTLALPFLLSTIGNFIVL